MNRSIVKVCTVVLAVWVGLLVGGAWGDAPAVGKEGGAEKGVQLITPQKKAGEKVEAKCVAW